MWAKSWYIYDLYKTKAIVGYQINSAKDIQIMIQDGGTCQFEIFHRCRFSFTQFLDVIFITLFIA